MKLGLALGVSAAALLAALWRPLAGASLDLDFARNRAFGVSFSDLSVTRASSGMAQRQDGTWVDFPANVPRITDKGLLVEEARTNLVTYSVVPQFGSNNWFVSPDIASTGTSGVTVNGIVGSTFAYTSAMTQAIGVFNETGGAWILQARSYTPTDKVQRAEFSFTAPAGCTSARVYASRNGAAGETTYTPTIVVPGATYVFSFFHCLLDGKLWVGGVQVEAGSFATSPIRTTGAAATRAADVTTLGTSPWFNGVEGTVFFERETGLDLANNTWFQIDNGGGTEYIRGRDASSGVWQAVVGVGNIAQTNMTIPAQTTGQRNKIAFAYRTDDCAQSFDGTAVSTDVSAAIPVGLTTLRLGNHNTNGEQPNGYLRRVAYFPSRLPNAQLQALTA